METMRSYYLYTSGGFQEIPEAVAYEGRSPHFGRLRAIFSGAGGGSETRERGGAARSRESRAKRCLSKLLRSFGLRCKL